MLILSTGVLASDWGAVRLLEFATVTCQDWEDTAEPAPGFATGTIVKSEIKFRETIVGTRHRVEIGNNALVELDVIERPGQPPRFINSLFGEFGDPQVLLSLNADCNLQVARTRCSKPSARKA